MKLIVSDKIRDICNELKIELPEESPITYIYVSVDDRRKLGYRDKSRYDSLVSEIIESHCKYSADKTGHALRLINEWFPNIREEGYDLMRTSTYICRAGKVLRKILPDISDETVQEFSTRFYDNNHKFEIRTDVTQVYDCKINSCMRGEDVDFYEDNDVKVLTLVRGDTIEGRALLWENVETKNGKRTFLDRPYIFDYNDTRLFAEYAKSNSWLFYQGDDTGMTYNLKTTQSDFYPYMDTMRWLSKENSTLDTDDGEFLLEVTDGYLEDDDDDNYVYSEHYGENIHVDDAVHSEYHNDYFHGRNSHYVNNDWFHDNDIGEIIIRAEDGILYWHEDVRYTVDGQFYLKDEVVETENGKVYLKDDDRIVETNDGFYLKESVIKLGGNWYVKDSDDVVFCETTKRYRINRTSKLEFKEPEIVKPGIHCDCDGV